jgi:uroporphyrinogen decarboxylase
MADKLQNQKLSGRERLLRTFRGEKTDRMPIAPFLYFNAVYEMFNYKPDMDFFWDPPDFDVVEKYIEYCDYFGFDVLHVLGSVWDFHLMNSWNDHSVIRPWKNWDVTVCDQRKDDAIRRSITIHTPEGELHCVENYQKNSTYLVVSAPEEYLIKTPKDFDIFRKYSPPADFMDCRMIQRARKAVGDKGLVDCNTTGVFNVLCLFRKLDDLLMDPVLDESFFREMIGYFTDRLIRRGKKMIESGADIIEVAAHLVSSMVGPDYCKKFVMEYENRLLNAVHEAGAFTIYHNCGDAAKIMHLYNDLDIDCWGYLTPPPFGDVNFDDALKVLKPDLVLRGNIDQVEFMMKATPLEVEDRVRDVVLKVKKRGHFILSTTDFFFDGTPYENIKAFVKAGLEYGQY